MSPFVDSILTIDTVFMAIFLFSLSAVILIIGVPE